MNSTITMQEDWTIGHSLHFYKVLYYCTSFIPAGLAFLFFPIIAIISHCCLAPKINKKPTDSDKNELIGCEFEFKKLKDLVCDNIDCECKKHTCCNNCKCDNCLTFFGDLLLNITIATSQFFFGATNIQLKDKISYKERCIKIGRGYYKLSLWTLLPLAWSNACMLASLIAVFCAFFIIKETDSCDESLDCFLADESDTTRITDCSMIIEQRVQVKCYEITHLQVLYALSFIGGLLKFVPILFKVVILFYVNTLYKKYKCCLCCLCFVNMAVIPLFIIVFGAWLPMLFMSPGKFYRLRHPYSAYIQSNMKRLGLIMALIALVGSLFLYPWYTLHENRMEQNELEEKSNSQDHADQPTNSNSEN